MPYHYLIMTARRNPHSRLAPLSPPLPLPAPLSPHWAFVVQLRQGTSFTPDGIQGRIEHIVSGQATTFASLEEARAFMEHVLTQQEEKPP